MAFMKIVPIRNFLFKTLVFSTLAAMFAGCAQGPSGSITVEGTLTGMGAQSAAATPSTLRLTQHQGASMQRVVETPDPRIEDLNAMTLRVDTVNGGPFRDEFVLATIVNAADQSAHSGIATHYEGSDPAWVQRREGELALLRLPVGDGRSGQSATRTFPSGSRQRAGATWLMRLQGNDPVVPWSIEGGDPRCVSISPSASFVAPPMGQTRDCFDLRTLTGMVLAHVAKTVTEALDDGPLPTVVTATRHDLFMVPSLDRANATGGPGFGLIYAAKLRIGEHGGPAQATILVPVTIHLRPAVTPGGAPMPPGGAIEAVFVPLSTAPQSSIGLGRVTIADQGRGIGSGLAREIRAIIVEHLETATISPITVDGGKLPAGQAIGRMIGAMAPQSAGANPLPPNLDVVALPVQRSATEDTVPTRLLTIPRVSTTIATGRATNVAGSDQPARPTATTRGDGTVTVTSPLDPPGRIRRVTTLSPMQTGEPYELRLLR